MYFLSFEAKVKDQVKQVEKKKGTLAKLPWLWTHFMFPLKRVSRAAAENVRSMVLTDLYETPAQG